MIAPECFLKPWLDQQAELLKVRDLALLERCIHALDLVARLRKAGLDFVFKGGTSLVLHLKPIRRLSIDVDIACNASMAQIVQALDAVVFPKAPFTRYVHQPHRDSAEPPKKHFLVVFNSAARPGTESHIMLDVLFETAVYAEIQEIELATDFVRTTESTLIKTPTVNSLLGDKLAAFAPETIGVLYDPPPTRAGDPAEPQQTRVAKQLYDVAELFNVAHNLADIRHTYENIRVVQNAYRKRSHTMADTLHDTIDAAFWLCQRNLKYGEASAKSDFLHSGVGNLDSHLVGNGFSIPAAKAAAARAACLAAMILRSAPETFSEIRAGVGGAAVMSGEPLVGRYERLRALRKTAPEAFYYWLQVAIYLNKNS